MYSSTQVLSDRVGDLSRWPLKCGATCMVSAQVAKWTVLYAVTTWMNVWHVCLNLYSTDKSHNPTIFFKKNNNESWEKREPHFPSRGHAAGSATEQRPWSWQGFSDLIKCSSARRMLPDTGLELQSSGWSLSSSCRHCKIHTSPYCNHR